MNRKIRVAYWANSSGSAYWRLRDPFFLLNQGNEFECRNATEFGVTREILEWADILVTQSMVKKEWIALMYEYQQEKGKKIVVEQDDYYTVKDDNPYKLHHDITNASEVIKITMGIADLVTVSTPYLKDELCKEDLSKNIVILPNYMLMDRWDLQPKMKNNSGSVRILWAGSITHIGDIEMVKKALDKLSKEFPQTEYYFVGDIRMQEIFKDIDRSEYMLGTDFLAWPSKLQGLQADIGIAPLVDAQFTRCKSWIKPLEYGINEIPSVVSDVEPYKDLKGWEGIYHVNTSDGWYNTLRGLIVDKDRRTREGEAVYDRIRKEMSLKDHIKLWSDTYKSLL